MSDLVSRVDEYSFQVMAKDSARFFVRVTSPRSSKTAIIFSDFILNVDDDGRAVEALHILTEQGFQIGPATRLVFQDICPCYSDSNDRSELTRRHDQIVNVIKNYVTQSGLKIDNIFLEPKGEKFETVVLIEG